MIFQRLAQSELDTLRTNRLGLLLLGPRQTGKSTLIQNFLSKETVPNLTFRLQETKTFEEIAKRPSIIFEATLAKLETGPLHLFIDEVQLVPELLNDCQSLIDQHADRLRVFLTGSSARKLRRSGTNLLPGRVLLKHLHPMTLPEFSKKNESRICPWVTHPSPLRPVSPFSYSLEEMMIWGTLPGVMQLEPASRTSLLHSYVSTYLQEEIRQEALTRRLGPFSRFLELAAMESGTAPNLSKLSQEAGIPLATLINYFQILEDTLIILRIPAFGAHGRKRVLTTPRYLFFDLGVRNACAGLSLHEGLLKIQAGTLFEQAVILDLIRRIDYLHAGEWKYYFWRTTYGAEVDLVINTGEELIPLEIKYSTVPRDADIAHLKTFMKTYGAKRGFLIGRFSRAQKMTDQITAIPWQEV